MAITSRDQVVAGIGRGFTGFAMKILTASVSTPRTYSMWNTQGFPTGPPGAPAAASATCSSATRGALPVPAIATPGNRLYLAGYSLFAYNNAVQLAGALAMYDRAAHMAGIAQNVTTGQAVNLFAPARLSSTVGYVPYMEYHTTGSATQTWTMSYTNSSGVAGRTATMNSVGAPVVGQLSQFVLQAGDVGVSSVQAVALTSAANTTAGTLAVVLARPLLAGALSGLGVAVRRNFVHMVDLGVDPCLMLAMTTSATAQTSMTAMYTVMEG